MKQMQSDRYKQARKVDLEVEHLDAADAPMSPGTGFIYLHNIVGGSFYDTPTGLTCIHIFSLQITLKNSSSLHGD